MESINKFANLEDQAEQKEYKTYKYIPGSGKNVDGDGGAEIKAIRERRKQYFRAKNFLQAAQSEQIKEQANRRMEVLRLETIAKREQEKEALKEKKDNARKYFEIRQDKRNQELAKRSPLHVENTLTRNDRVKLYNKHHKCTHHKRFDTIVEGKEEFVCRCTHSGAILMRKSSHKCLNCGMNQTEKYKNACGCYTFYCNKCKSNNYYYKNIRSDEKIYNNANQFYDCHSRGDEHLTFTVHEEESSIEIDGEVVLVPGSKKDIVVIDLEMKPKKFTPAIPRKNFYHSLKTDANATYAEKIAGKMKEEKPIENSEIISFPKIEEKEEEKEEIVEEEDKIRKPTLADFMTVNNKSIKNQYKVMKSKEQGGVISSVTASAKAGADTLTTQIKEKVGNLSEGLSKIIEGIEEKQSMIVDFNDTMEFLNICKYVISVIRDYVDFQNLTAIGFIIKNLIDNKSHKVANTIHFINLIANIHTKDQIYYNKLRVLRLKNIDTDLNSYLRTNRKTLFSHCGTLASMCKRMLLHTKHWMIDTTQKNTYKLTPAALKLIKETCISSYMLGVQEEAGILDSLGGFCMGIREYLSTVVDAVGGFFGIGGLKKFSLFLKDLIPLCVIANTTSNIIPKIISLIKRYIFGNVSNEVWLDNQIAEKDTLCHKLYSTYVAYVGSTIIKKKDISGDVISGLRAKFYEVKAEVEKQVLEEHRYSTKYASWLKHMETGLAVPPQPTEREFEPTVLCLEGKPGVGKSTIWPLILGAVEEKSTKEIREKTHTFNNASDYQTGMLGKQTILFDDFGQDRETSVETINLIKLCTSAPYPINSANIQGQEIKGMFADPEFLVLCTNDTSLASDKLFSKDAVVRRVDFKLELIKKLNFNDKKELISDPAFKVLGCPRYNTFVGKLLSLQQVISIFKVLHKSKRADYRKINDTANLVIKELDLDEILNTIDAPSDNHDVAFFSSSVDFAKDYAFYLKDKGAELPADLLKHIKTEDLKEVMNGERKVDTRNSVVMNVMDLIEDEMERVKIDLAEHKRHEPIRDDFQEKKKFTIEHERWENRMDEIRDYKAKLEKEISDEKEYVNGVRDERYIATRRVRPSKPQYGISMEALIHHASVAISIGLDVALDAIVPSCIVASYISTTESMYNIIKRPSKDTIMNGVWRFIKVALVGICTVFAASMLYAGYASIENSGTTKTAKASNKTLSSVDQSGESVEESGQINDGLINIVKRATGHLVTEEGRTNNCLAIKGNWILTVAHFFYDFDTPDNLMKEGTEIVYQPSGSKQVIIFPFERKSLKRFPNKSFLFDNAEVRPDMVLYLIDHKLMNAQKDITKFFWDGTYTTKGMNVMKIDYLPKYSIYGENKRLTQNIHYDFTTTEYELCKGIVTYDQIITQRVKGKDKYYHVVAVSNYKARDTSCGSAVIRTDTEREFILGIHVAATISDNQSMFHYVTRGELETAMSTTVTISVEQSQYINYSANEDFKDMPLTHQFQFEGIVEKKFRSFQNAKTELQPSLLFEALGEHKTEPSLLTTTDPRFPEKYKGEFWKTMYKGYANYSNFRYEELMEATESIITENRGNAVFSPIKAKILNDYEVLNGVENWESVGAIPMNTSCGWPYNTAGMKCKKKEDLINVQEYENKRVLTFKDLLRNDYEHANALIKKGVKPFLPFTATLKDERLPLRKIYEEPKSRIFMNGNLIHYLISRKYFAYFLERSYRNPDSYMSVRLDRVSVDWHFFITKLIEVGIEGFDGDYKFYDRFINRVLLYCNFLIIVDGLVKEKLMIQGSPEYMALMELMCAPNIIFGMTAVVANGVLPSGNLLTLVGNCNINEILHRSGYLYLARKVSPYLGTISHYKQHTRGKRGGDDTIQMVSAEVSDFFNAVTFSEWLAKHGVEYTAADKLGEIVALKPFKELSFLKNTTGTMHGYYVPLGDFDALVEQCYWIRLNKENVCPIKATEDNTNAALRAIYFYGKQRFNEVREKFLEKEPRLTLLTFEELNCIWKAYGYFPGSQADYATKQDQDGSGHPKDKTRIVSGITLGNHSIKLENMEMIESIEQTNEAGQQILNMIRGGGKDVNTAHVEQTHPDPPLDEHIKVEVRDETPTSSTNEGDGSQTNVNGAFIESKEQPIRKQAATGKKYITPADFRAQGHVNDKNWTLSRLASKFTSLGTFSWAINMVPGTIIKQWALPNDVLITQAMQTPFEVTGYSRMKSITFKITASASPFYAGRLVCGFVPTMNSTNLTTDLHLRLIQLGGIVMNPVENQTVEFSVPFRHYLDWLEYPYDFLGHFSIVVLNQLKTGTDNVNNITISAFVTIEEAQFKVPEYIGTTSKTAKYLTSRPQSGRISNNVGEEETEDTAITIKKRVADVNSNFQDSYTMLCAGTGLYSEPSVKHFPDHPVDIVQYLKRDRVIDQLFVKVPAYDTNISRPGNVRYTIPYMTLVENVVGRYMNVFKLCRGSMAVRVDYKCTDLATKQTIVPGTSVLARAYVFNTVPIDEEYEFLSTIKQTQIGYHKFDDMCPGTFSIPWLSPNFTGVTDGTEDVNLTPISHVAIEFLNYSLKEVAVMGHVEARLEDDFSMGVFMGMGKISLTKSKSAVKGWYMFSKEESGIITAVETVVENMRPVMETFDLLGDVLDAPPITVQPAPMMLRKWNFGNANNIMQYTEKLGMTNHNSGSYADKSAYGTTTPETNIYDLIQNVKTITNTLTWNVTDPAGKLLITKSVGPQPEDVYDKMSTPLDFIARDFNYWAGSIIYALDVVSSQMHTGRLLISYHPNLSTSQGLTLEKATQQYFVTFDLDKGKGCTVIGVPYLYKMPFRPITKYSPSSTVSAMYPPDQSFNGIVCVWVMNPLRASTTVAQSVDINIYKMGGKDFRLETLGSYVNKDAI